MAEFSTEQVLPFTFKVTDGRGRVVATEGEPVATSSDETVATVSISGETDNVWSGEVRSVAAGEGRVSITADADLGEGTLEVVGLLDITVTLDPRTAARTAAVEAGAPTDKPV